MTTTEQGHHIVWAVSHNSDGWTPTEPGRVIGFVPRDNADDHLPRPVTGDGLISADTPLGGIVASRHRILGEPW